MSSRDEVARQALALSPEDRAFVADILESSLWDADQFDRDLAAKWTMELDRRIDAYDRGETTSMDIETAMRDLRRSLDERRASDSQP